MLTREDLQKKIINLILFLDRNALKRSFVWSNKKRSYRLDIIFTLKTGMEFVSINKSEMPYVYNYFNNLILGVKKK